MSDLYGEYKKTSLYDDPRMFLATTDSTWQPDSLIYSLDFITQNVLKPKPIRHARFFPSKHEPWIAPTCDTHKRYIKEISPK